MGYDMMMYSLEKGKIGKLIHSDGTVVDWTLRQNMAMFSEDIAIDSIRLHNNKRKGCYIKPVTEQDRKAEELAELGYTVFQMLYKHGGRTKIYFATHIDENDSEMD